MTTLSVLQAFFKRREQSWQVPIHTKHQPEWQEIKQAIVDNIKVDQSLLAIIIHCMKKYKKIMLWPRTIECPEWINCQRRAIFWCKSCHRGELSVKLVLQSIDEILSWKPDVSLIFSNWGGAVQSLKALLWKLKLFVFYYKTCKSFKASTNDSIELTTSCSFWSNLKVQVWPFFCVRGLFKNPD